MSRLVGLALLLVSAPLPAPAQESCAPIERGQPVPFCRLDSAQTQLDSSIRTRFPPVFDLAGKGGTVRLGFVVDTTGRAIPWTMRPTPESNKNFVAPAQEAVSRYQFPRYVLAAVRVQVVLEVEIEFVAASQEVPARQVLDQQRTFSGYRLRFGMEPVARAVPAAALSAEDSLAAMRVVLLDKPPTADTTGRALCVTLGGKDLDAETLETVRRYHTGAVRLRDCPHTYATWIITPGQKPRPKGALDPQHLAMSMEVWTTDLVVVSVRTGHGLSGTGHYCDVGRESGTSVWRIQRCRRDYAWAI